MARWLVEDTIPEAILTTSFTLCEGILNWLRTVPNIANPPKLATFGDHHLLDLQSLF